jgi:hypothetical protein
MIEKSTPLMNHEVRMKAVESTEVKEHYTAQLGGLKRERREEYRDRILTRKFTRKDRK